MASLARGNNDEARRAALSPRPKGRENVKETLCRNVTIYGHCRYETKGCSFNHDPLKVNNADNKKRFNVDSPSFTPAVQNSPSLSVNGANAKGAGISPKAANAAPFKPKAFNGGTVANEQASFSRGQYNPAAADWSTDVPDYLQSAQNLSHGVNSDAKVNADMYNAFTGGMQNMTDASLGGQQSLMNAYGADPSQGITQPFFPSSTLDQQPAQYHLYASFGAKRENLAPHQRIAHDLFIPDPLREDLQKKSAETNKVTSTGIGLLQLSNATRTNTYHSFLPLDLTPKKSNEAFGYTSSVYKVTGRDGKHYALRRVEGWISTHYDTWTKGNYPRWKSLNNASIVNLAEAFPSREWPDEQPSLIVVSEYHPLSKTLAQLYTQSGPIRGREKFLTPDSQTLWSYVTQITNALKAIHSEGLAARVLLSSKILVTDKNRIRLTGCGVVDMLRPDEIRPPADLQREDLVQFGRLIVQLGVGLQAAQTPNINVLIEHFRTRYPNSLAEKVGWLLNPAVPNHTKTIDNFMNMLQPQIMTTFNAALDRDDELTVHLSRELENARMFRLMVKLNMILERDLPVGNNQQWSETGERYPIKLFRDYIFHQVDENGLPILDLAHVVTCLNKLDAGVDEKITLTTRDESTVILVSYKEMKRAIASAFEELSNSGRRRAGF